MKILQKLKYKFKKIIAYIIATCILIVGSPIIGLIELYHGILKLYDIAVQKWWLRLIRRKRKQNPKIAVFGYHREFENACFEPRNLFIHIGKVSDVRGRDFIGCILLYGYNSNREYMDALREFQYRNPKLFKR